MWLRTWDWWGSSWRQMGSHKGVLLILWDWCPYIRGKAGRLQFQCSRSRGKRISSCLRPGIKWDAVSKGREGGREGEGTHWRAHTGNAVREDSRKASPWSLTRNQPERGLVSPELVLLGLTSFMQRWILVEAYLFNIKSYLFISSYFLIANVTLLGWHYGENRRFHGWCRIVSFLEVGKSSHPILYQ